MNIVIATTKSWNIRAAERLKQDHREHSITIVEKKESLTENFLEEIKPDYIFFPHWSWIIPASIYDSFNCVVFHMTDLPFGRGGSPLQNLIIRGVYETKISAIKVSAGMDTGPVYFKEPVNISEGSADEMLTKISQIVFEKMIPRFLEDNPTPFEQQGDVVEFKRRTPEQSEIPDGLKQRQIYDYIRMLDGEGYPTAYRCYDKGKIYYTNARFEDGIVTAKARFVEDES